ncbi:MAG: diacylglycerol kinase family protein [Ruthenibacterium sp.]
MQAKRFLNGFRYAANGIRLAIKEERNMRFHLCAAALVYYFSIPFDFTATQWMLLTLCVCGVLALELVNSALERCVEKPSPDKYELAGAVKDMAAGAVLVFCIGAAVCGIILFWKIDGWQWWFQNYKQHPSQLICIVLVIGLMIRFIFRVAPKKERG